MFFIFNPSEDSGYASIKSIILMHLYLDPCLSPIILNHKSSPVGHNFKNKSTLVTSECKEFGGYNTPPNPIGNNS
jgi:hypothetical protein